MARRTTPKSKPAQGAGDPEVVEMLAKGEIADIALLRPPCLCGCGGYPKGAKARFVPGHDARYHSAQKAAAKAAEAEATGAAE